MKKRERLQTFFFCLTAIVVHFDRHEMDIALVYCLDESSVPVRVTSESLRYYMCLSTFYLVALEHVNACFERLTHCRHFIPSFLYADVMDKVSIVPDS